MSEQIKVLIKDVGKPARIGTIDNALQAMKDIVNGYIEAVYVTDNIMLICNEEGKICNLPLNFIIDNKLLTDGIHGNVFFTKVNEDGDNVSLNDNDIKCIEQFASASIVGMVSGSSLGTWNTLW